MRWIVGATAALCALSITAADAATVRSKSGQTASVSERAAPSFQCLIDGLEEAGYKITEMGGYPHRRGAARHYSLHPSGNAIDINQMSRNVVSSPLPKNHIQIANKCGAVDGAQWTNHPDQGHWQIGGWAGERYTAPKPLTTYAKKQTPKIKMAAKVEPKPVRIEIASADPDFVPAPTFEARFSAAYRGRD